MWTLPSLNVLHLKKKNNHSSKHHPLSTFLLSFETDTEGEGWIGSLGLAYARYYVGNGWSKTCSVAQGTLKLGVLNGEVGRNLEFWNRSLCPQSSSTDWLQWAKPASLILVLFQWVSHNLIYKYLHIRYKRTKCELDRNIRF